MLDVHDGRGKATPDLPSADVVCTYTNLHIDQNAANTDHTYQDLMQKSIHARGSIRLDIMLCSLQQQFSIKITIRRLFICHRD